MDGAIRNGPTVKGAADDWHLAFASTLCSMLFGDEALLANSVLGPVTLRCLCQHLIDLPLLFLTHTFV